MRKLEEERSAESTFCILEKDDVKTRMQGSIPTDVLDVRTSGREVRGSTRYGMVRSGGYLGLLGRNTLHIGHTLVAWSIEPNA